MFPMATDRKKASDVSNVVMRAQHSDHIGRHADIPCMPREPKLSGSSLRLLMARNNFDLIGIEYIKVVSMRNHVGVDILDKLESPTPITKLAKFKNRTH